MSRIGKNPIEIPEGIEVNIDDNNVVLVKGSKGELKIKINNLVKIEKKEKEIIVSVNSPQDKKQAALWGLSRTLIFNMIEGITKGFEKKLEVNGVGYRVSLSGKKLILNVGYSHAVEFEFPDGIKSAVEGNVITVSGIDKQLVGEVAARIRKIRKPEPYKGKGIKYIDETIRRKAGKAAKATE